MLRGAIIGFGKIAQTGHLPAYYNEKISSKAAIVAVAEPDPKYRRDAQSKIPNLNLYDTIDDLLANEKIDFVDICTPPSYHPYEIARCAGPGIHVLCEKPFALRLDEAAATAEILEKKSGMVFMCCHQYRYSQIWRQFKEFVANGGKDLRHLLQFNIYRRGADEGYLTRNPNWRTDPQFSGGGILVDTGIHYLYLASWMLGKPHNISAGIYNLRGEESNVEDTAVINVVCEKGLAQITLTWGAGYRSDSARLTNNAGSLNYNGTQIERITGSGRELIGVPDSSVNMSYVDLYISLIGEFISRIERGDDDGEGIEEAYQSVEMIEAGYQSARTGQIIKLDWASSLSPIIW
jgi:predicted dehydrogenase